MAPAPARKRTGKRRAAPGERARFRQSPAGRNRPDGQPEQAETSALRVGERQDDPAQKAKTDLFRRTADTSRRRASADGVVPPGLGHRAERLFDTAGVDRANFR